MTLADAHVALLATRHPGTSAAPLPSGTRIVTVPAVALPPGWNKAAADVLFLIPAQYPYAPPDCFWADEDLRLAAGGMPQNAQPGNAIPEVPGQYLWFSWHLGGLWNPNRDTLATWYNAIVERFRRAV